MQFVGAIFDLSKFNLLANFGPMLVKYLLNKLLMLPAAAVTVSKSFDMLSGICLCLMWDFIKLFTFFLSIFMSFLLCKLFSGSKTFQPIISCELAYFYMFCIGSKAYLFFLLTIFGRDYFCVELILEELWRCMVFVVILTLFESYTFVEHVYVALHKMY